jgi:hypothetical protein
MNFVVGQSQFWPTLDFALDVVDNSLPFLHYCAANNFINSTFRSSSIAIASVLYAHSTGSPAFSMQYRDEWLRLLIERFNLSQEVVN